MAERQFGTKYSDFRADHIGRYEWAAGFVSGLVLDAACGCGYGTNYLAKHSKAHLLGIDVDEESIRYASNNWSFGSENGFMKCDLESRGLNLPEYDWIVSFETIEHLELDVEVLSKFAQSAPNLLVSVPNELNIPFDKKRFPYHVRHYTPEQFSSILGDAGWGVDEILTQKDAQTRIPVVGADGRTLVAVCSRK